MHRQFDCTDAGRIYLHIFYFHFIIICFLQFYDFVYIYRIIDLFIIFMLKLF